MPVEVEGGNSSLSSREGSLRIEDKRINNKTLSLGVGARLDIKREMFGREKKCGARSLGDSRDFAFTMCVGRLLGYELLTDIDLALYYNLAC